MTTNTLNQLQDTIVLVNQDIVTQEDCSVESSSSTDSAPKAQELCDEDDADTRDWEHPIHTRRFSDHDWAQAHASSDYLNHHALPKRDSYEFWASVAASQFSDQHWAEASLSNSSHEHWGI